VWFSFYLFDVFHSTRFFLWCCHFLSRPLRRWRWDC
jgi:hypothetical protein